jgi:hypothetical protein
MQSSRYAWLTIGACGLGLGCGAGSSSGESGPRFQIDVRVESDPGKPLAAVKVLQGETALGSTADNGTVRITLGGHNGDVLTLRVACPADYASPDKPLSVTLRPLVGASVPLYRAQCQPLLRSLVVAVRAKGGAGLPVKHLGREVARTDAEGTAHVLLQVPPAEQITLVLDTSEPSHERLRPQSPEFTLVMPARDEVAVFDQTFSELAPPRPKARPRGPAQPVGPIKIERPR